MHRKKSGDKTVLSPDFLFDLTDENRPFPSAAEREIFACCEYSKPLSKFVSENHLCCTLIAEPTI